MTFKELDPAHIYEVTGGQQIKFIKRTNGELIHEGTTNEELTEVLIHRLEQLDAELPCIENYMALSYYKQALRWLNERTAKRVAQDVETKDLPHVSKNDED